MINKDSIPVLFVYYEPFVSGQTAHVLSLIKGLDRSRFQIEVLLPEELTTAARLMINAGARVRLLPIRKTFWKPAAVSQLLRSIREQRGGIIHIHSQEAGLIARPLAKLGGARHIFYTPQTIDIRRQYLHGIYTRIESGMARFTDRILSVNEFDRQRLISWGISPQKVETVYNGIELDERYSDEDPKKLRQMLGLREEGSVVMQIGRLSVQKAPLDFINGAAIVLSHRPDVQFVMIGDGPCNLAVQKRLQKLGLEGQIKLAGTQDQASRLIPAANLITLTSLWEGMPYSLLEAMASQKPVVCTRVNGCPEIVEDRRTGLLVPPGQPGQWAQAVMKLIDEPEIALTYGRAGRQRVEERFSLHEMISKVENLYEQAISY